MKNWTGRVVLNRKNADYWGGKKKNGKRSRFTEKISGIGKFETCIM